MSSKPEKLIYEFSEATTVADWAVVDDLLIGGRSQGNFLINEERHGVFEGMVMLLKSGGYSSMRHILPKPVAVGTSTRAVMRVKGSPTIFQFRLKSNKTEYHSYVAEFEGTGQWQEVELELAKFMPVFKGRKLAQQNYPGETVGEVAFWVSNRKAEKFRLEVDWIGLR